MIVVCAARTTIETIVPVVVRGFAGCVGGGGHGRESSINTLNKMGKFCSRLHCGAVEHANGGGAAGTYQHMLLERPHPPSAGTAKSQRRVGTRKRPPKKTRTSDREITCVLGRN